MPGDFKLKLEEDTDDKLWYVASDQSAVDTITFNTKLKLANVSYLSANNLVVAKNDPSYQSIEGVIYTKDGKGIVRVPQKRTELKIKEGCTEFNMQSVLYNSTDSEGDEFNNCSKLKKIVIPSSVTLYSIFVDSTPRPSKSPLLALFSNSVTLSRAELELLLASLALFKALDEFSVALDSLF